MAAVWARWPSWCWTRRATAKVNRDQLDQVEGELTKGAEANGYPNDVWTLQRVADVNERVKPTSRLRISW